MHEAQHQSHGTQQSLDAGPSGPPAALEGEPGAAADVARMLVDATEKNVGAAHPVPELLDPARLDEYRLAYYQEYQPVGPTEHAIVRELAHHAAAMDLWNETIGAVERQGARGLPDFALPAGESGSTLEDAVLAGAMSQEIVDRCEKYLQFHSRAFYRALGKLEDLQTRRKKVEGGESVMPSNPFTDETTCECYLAERFKAGACRCPRCGGTAGRHIISRRCWECADCGSQSGLRCGTVMADSPIRLTTWFSAIWLLLHRPTITTAELASTLGIARIMTVRSMAHKIRAAMTAENASDLLAGIDAYGVAGRATAAESSARQDGHASESNGGPS
jgi:hypothetical protein